MGYDAFLQALQDTAFATEIRESELLFPWIECLHVVAITLVVGTISIVDLRLLGFASMDRSAGQLARRLLPWTWGAFVCAAITGGLLFAANAMTYGHNDFFLRKMVMLAFAGLNMAAFHAFTGRDIDTWGPGAVPPAGARIAGGLSLTIWIVVVGFGRWIGFTLK